MAATPIEQNDLNKRRAALNEYFRCFITLLPAADNPKHGPLGAIAVGVKDCIDIAGVPCTWGSGVHIDRIADADAFVITLIKAAGATIVGTTNLHEFAFGGTTQNAHFGSCRNAWRPDVIPGGSSGGSAVAVALGLCDLGIGTDTGASIRMPAALNGILGLRPTHGAVSASGVMPVSPPYDTVGFMARDVDTLRRAIAVTYKIDHADPFSVVIEMPRLSKKAFKIGILDALVTGCEVETSAAFGAVTRQLSASGATCIPIVNDGFKDAARILASVIIADAASFHRQRLTRQADRIGAAVHERIASGLSMPAIEYAERLRWLEAFKATVWQIFQEVDFLICPTVPVSPPRIDSAQEIIATTASLSRNCWAAPAAGLPALSVPCGLDRQGVPIGLQIIGPRDSDLALLDLAERYVLPGGKVDRPPRFANPPC